MPITTNRYLAFSKSAYYAVVGSLPILVVYELLVLLSKEGRVEMRNAADVWLRTVLGAFGLTPTQAYLVMILLLVLAIPVVRGRGVVLVPRYFAIMVGEALVYSVLLGIAIDILLVPVFFTFGAFVQTGTGGAGIPLAVPAIGGFSQIVSQSLGAGLFEEFVFRVILLNGFLAMARLIFREWLAALISITAAAFFFSLAHYIGALGDVFGVHSFLFRWMAGMLFTMLYYWRGFAVTAYAHALYDIRVLLF